MTYFQKYIQYFFIFILVNFVGLNAQTSDFNFNNWFGGSKNFIELSYGIGTYKHNKINSSTFNKIANKELKVGKRFQKPIASYKIISFSDNYFFSSYVNDYNIKEIVYSISGDNWRFGLGYRKGYVNNFDGFLIMPYYEMGLVWNQINLKYDHPIDSLMRPAVVLKNPFIEPYKNDLRFGTQNIGGIDFLISSTIDIGLSYETAVVFPYHKFWKQAGSLFIETLAQTGIDFFIEGVIIDNVPVIAPVLNFMLKNGLSYYFYTLKQEKMNFPFSTIAPLTMETYNLNLKISF